MDKKTIKIPTEIKLKTEFFDGYGMSELIRTIIVGAISSITAYVINIFTHQKLLSTFFVLGSIVVSVVALTKGQNNFSMVDMIKNIVRYNFMQRDYKYRRRDFYNKYIKENNKEEGDFTKRILKYK